jgi:hypothetical protein
MKFGCEPRTLSFPDTTPADTDVTLPLPGLSPVTGKPLIARFNGGSVLNDGSLLALREVEARLAQMHPSDGTPARLGGCGHPTDSWSLRVVRSR